ncbi:helix-turn-helix domain-containing protein [Aetokthonos hydrillicola Thurmond2011]|uniref:Helix-turn-helix domain-containing protein n=2 Tax=Aetokthonos TaxID=1550243 RepID=A0AAP5I9J6_9CYAN|nr:substrate-binding domain-containing protein [Aetokthonos hydrillicola]MBW4591280.1 helix-turn-helix domain-containing protein [Aetokthonos hydrillicola CCALA 1050]MDR9897385.1 helix-turn-helix domain-containing protein [Aetokthonos hydrillicola Thurmond2011]
MKQDSKLRNNLKSIRTRLKMSQQDLADLAGVTRQTISGVEAGQYAPSVVITLRLAKALGCQVEDIFSLEQDVPEIEAVAAKPFTDGQRSRVSVARVGGQWIAYPLIGKDAFRQDMIPADGEAIGVGRHSDPNDFPKEELPKQSSYISNPPNPDGETKKQVSTNRVRVKLLDDNLDTLHNTVVIAGCAPVISLWARATERWHPQLRVQYNFANSMAALHSLSRGEVHIAGMHLYDPRTGEYNTSFVRDVLAGRHAVLITLGVWEEGLLIKSGNPKRIRTVEDLMQQGTTIINREIGSGSRMLLEQTLKQHQIPFDAVQGFDSIVRSHQDVAQAVELGVADAGVSTGAVAAAFELEFIPLHRSRYDLVILKEYLEEEPIQKLLSTLGHRLVHSQLEILGGYDISNIGEVVATV